MFLLCAVQHHQQRLWGPNKERYRCEFPKIPWFVQLVQSHGLAEWLKRSTNSAKFLLVGLIRCRPGIVAEDLLSRYEHRAELEVWKSFWTGMGNMFTVIVEELFVLETPQYIHTCRDHRYEEPRPLVGRPNPLSPFIPLSCPDLLSASGALWDGRSDCCRSCMVVEALAGWSLEHTEGLLGMPVLEPVASLIAKRVAFYWDAWPLVYTTKLTRLV